MNRLLPFFMRVAMGGFGSTVEYVSPSTGGGAGGGGEDDILSATLLRLALLSPDPAPLGECFSSSVVLEVARVVSLLGDSWVGRTGAAFLLCLKPSAAALDLTLRDKGGSSVSPIDGGVCAGVREYVGATRKPGRGVSCRAWSDTQASRIKAAGSEGAKPR